MVPRQIFPRLVLRSPFPIVSVSFRLSLVFKNDPIAWFGDSAKQKPLTGAFFLHTVAARKLERFSVPVGANRESG